MQHRGLFTLLLFAGVLILSSVSATATCTFDRADTWPCQSASPDGHTYGGSAGSNAELRYRLVDCNTGQVYGSGMTCSNQVSPAYYPPLGTTVRWVADIYQCAYCGEGGGLPSCTDTQCNQNDYYGDWGYYCKENDGWQHRRFYDYGCVQNSCNLMSSNYADERLLIQNSPDCTKAEISGYEITSVDRDLQPKRFYAAIHNIGSSTMRNVRATLLDALPNLLTLVPDASYGDIPVGENRTSLNEYVIQVNGDFPDIGMDFRLEWTDDTGAHTAPLHLIMPSPIYYHKHAYEIASGDEMFANLFVKLIKSTIQNAAIKAVGINIPLPWMVKVAYFFATLPGNIKQISENRWYRDDILIMITDKNDNPLNGVLIREGRYDGYPLYVGYKEWSAGGIVHWSDREYLPGPLSDPVLHDIVVEYGGMKFFISLSKYDNRVNIEEVPVVRVKFNDMPSMIEVSLASSSDLHIYDMIGRHMGLNYTSGQMENDFDDGTLQDAEHMELPAGDYRIVLVGKASGDDHLTVQDAQTKGILTEEQFTTQPGIIRPLFISPNVTENGYTLNMGQEPNAMCTDAELTCGNSVEECVTLVGQGACKNESNASANIVGLWHFDETSGTTAYDSGPYKLDGQVINNTSIVQGKFGNARELSSGYILLGDKQELRPESIQVSAWIKTTAGDYQAIFTTGRVQFGSGASAKQYGIALGISDGKPEVEVGTGLAQAIFVLGNRTINDGAWHFTQARYTKAANASFELALFADDELQGTVQGKQPILYASNYKESVIGARKYSSTVDWKFSGTIDEVQASSITFCNGDCNVTNTTNTTRDTTPPAITINEPTSRNYSYTEILIPQFSATDTNGIDSTNAVLEGTSVSSGQQISLVSFPLGQHTFIVTASDTAGNTATQNVTFIVIDNVPPISQAAVQGTLGADGWYTSNVTVTLTSSDEKSPVQRIEYNLDNAGYGPYTSPVPILQTSANATRVLTFRAMDAVGNVEAEKSITLKIKAKITEPKILAWWKLDEGNGTILFDSGTYRINGQVIGGSKIVAGKYGNARQFSGAGYVLLGDRQELRPENISIEALVSTKATSVMSVFTTGRVQFGSGVKAKQYGIALMLSKGKPSVEVGTGASQALATGGTATINDGNWHLLQAQYVKKAIGRYELSLFVDGKLQSTVQGTGQILYTPSYKDSTIAARKYGSTVDWKLTGTIDDVRVRTY